MESAFHKSDKYIIVLNNSSEKLYDLMLELGWHTQKVERFFKTGTGKSWKHCVSKNGNIV